MSFRHRGQDGMIEGLGPAFKDLNIAMGVTRGFAYHFEKGGLAQVI
jgi:hypothetical protein